MSDPFLGSECFDFSVKYGESYWFLRKVFFQAPYLTFVSDKVTEKQRPLEDKQAMCFCNPTMSQIKITQKVFRFIFKIEYIAYIKLDYIEVHKKLQMVANDWTNMMYTYCISPLDG